MTTRTRLWLRNVLACGGLSLLGSGCAVTSDDLTSRKFRDKLVDAPFQTLWVRPDPMVVLRSGEDGDEIARALPRLEEPARVGRPQEEQDEVVGLLSKMATADARPVCRLAAIEALGRFEDPRAATALVAAYRNAGQTSPTADAKVLQAGFRAGLGLPMGSVPQEQATAIQCRALAALGKHRSQDGLKLLVETSQAPQKRADDELPPPTELRLTAIRSLREYKDPQAVRALVAVLQSEKDVAMRDRAHEGLVKITGRNLPAEGQGWEAALAPDFQMRESEPPGTIERVGAWFLSDDE